MKQKLSYKCISDYPVDTLTVRFMGEDCCIHALIGGYSIFHPVPDQVYYRYRDMFYLCPAKAKNYLLDNLSFEGLPFSRDEFNFVETNPISEETLQGLRKFVKGLK